MTRRPSGSWALKRRVKSTASTPRPAQSRSWPAGTSATCAAAEAGHSGSHEAPISATPSARVQLALGKAQAEWPPSWGRHCRPTPGEAGGPAVTHRPDEGV